MNQVVAIPSIDPKATSDKVNLLDFDRQGLRDFFAQLGEKPYRAEQVMKWIYHRLEDDFGRMTDVGKALRAKLEATCYVGPPKTLFDKAAADGTHKWLLGMDGGNAIEAVYIPEPTRGTLCVSSQVGCGLNCQFCSTATQGFNRKLAQIKTWPVRSRPGDPPEGVTWKATEPEKTDRSARGSWG